MLAQSWIVHECVVEAHANSAPQTTVDRHAARVECATAVRVVVEQSIGKRRLKCVQANFGIAPQTGSDLV